MVWNQTLSLIGSHISHDWLASVTSIWKDHNGMKEAIKNLRKINLNNRWAWLLQIVDNDRKMWFNGKIMIT